jgi:hypothetical protein
MFEHKHQKLAPTRVFARRMLSSILLAGALILCALLIGILGYRHFAGYAWIDALLEASMILGGMGPINALPTDTAKLFASAYALFSGLVFIAIMGIILAPATHRMLHKFHMDEQDLN